MYCRNNPLRYIDPDGLDWKDWDLRWLAKIGDVSSGLADAVTCGVVGKIQDKMGVTNYIARSSMAYKVGKGLGHVGMAVANVYSAGQGYMALSNADPHTLMQGLATTYKVVKSTSSWCYAVANVGLAINNITTGEKEEVPQIMDLLKNELTSSDQAVVNAGGKLIDLYTEYKTADAPDVLEYAVDSIKESGEKIMESVNQ